MRNRRTLLLAGTLNVLLALPLPAAEPAPEPTNQREYEPQPLPDDVFTPSEQVSEDYPVPFPVDI